MQILHGENKLVVKNSISFMAAILVVVVVVVVVVSKNKKEQEFALSSK